MMRVALNRSKDTTTPERNCHVGATYTRKMRRKMRRMEPEEVQRTRGIAFDCGRSGPAGRNAAAVDALSDPAARKQLENHDLQTSPEDKLTAEALGTWQNAEIAKWWPVIKAANVKVD